MRSAAVGVDIGGTKVAAAVVTPAREGGVGIGPVHRQATPRVEAAEVADTVAAVVRDACEEDADARDLPVGVGVAGLLRADGTMIEAPNTRAMVGVDVASLLGNRLGRPVAVGNDVNCAAVAEHRAGAARRHRDVVMVSLGTGIGAGVVIDGRLHTGSHGLAGEAGHLVLDEDGPPCPCGRRGCWERYASGSGLAHLARQAAAAGRLARLTEAAGGDPLGVTGEAVIEGARAGDPETAPVLDEFAAWVARGLAALAAVLDPGAFVLGGGLVAAADLWIDRVRASFSAQVLAGGERPPIEILPAAHGPQATLVGAALLADDAAGDP